VNVCDIAKNHIGGFNNVPNFLAAEQWQITYPKVIGASTDFS
jgi:hypothetical protein